MWRYSLFPILLLFWVLPTQSFAQFSGVSENVSLVVEPRYPEPGEQIAISLNDFALGRSANTIQWQIDGVLETAFSDQRRISLIAPAIDESIRVTAQIISGGVIIPVEAVITSSRLTIILEPQTSAPSWYKGRPLPSVGSLVRAVAIPQTGVDTPLGEYFYTWRVNNAVANAGAIRGQYENVFAMPFGRETTLTVDVSDASGAIVAQRTVLVPAVEPEVYFYGVNPLRGPERLAYGAQQQLLGAEMTMRAESYHIDNRLSDADTLFEWKVDGRTVENPNIDQRNITLQNGGGTGQFNVSFHIRNLEALLQGARNSITILF